MSAPVGRFLRGVRIGRGILLGDLARRVGITSAELSAIEHGRSVPDEAHLRRLLAALSLDLPADPASGPDPALDPTPLPDPTSTPVLEVDTESKSVMAQLQAPQSRGLDMTCIMPATGRLPALPPAWVRHLYLARKSHLYANDGYAPRAVCGKEIPCVHVVLRKVAPESCCKRCLKLNPLELLA